MKKKLYRSTTDKKLAGVCGGIADGQTLFDTRHFNDAPKNVYVCLDTDEDKFSPLLYVKKINGAFGSLDYTDDDIDDVFDGDPDAYWNID